VAADSNAQAATGDGGYAVTVTLPSAPTVTCDMIGPGRLTIVFGRSAGLGNPVRAGTYTVGFSHQVAALRSEMLIHAG
jgi:hypothetical protein